jgi:hypothetical protein
LDSASTQHAEAEKEKARKIQISKAGLVVNGNFFGKVLNLLKI